MLEYEATLKERKLVVIQVEVLIREMRPMRALKIHRGNSGMQDIRVIAGYA